MTETGPRTRFDAQDFWADLAGDHPDLLFATTGKFERLAEMPALDRDRLVAGLLDFEAGLPGADLQHLLSAELSALGAIPSGPARAILATIECYHESSPAANSVRRMVALQAAFRNLSVDERAQLGPLMPSIRKLAGMPAVVTTPITTTPAIPERPRRGPLARLFSRP